MSRVPRTVRPTGNRSPKSSDTHTETGVAIMGILFAFTVVLVIPTLMIVFKVAAKWIEWRERRRLNRAYWACQSPRTSKPPPVAIAWPAAPVAKPRRRGVGFGLVLACLALIAVAFLAAATAHSAIPSHRYDTVRYNVKITVNAPRAHTIVIARDDTQRALDAEERRRDREHERYIDRTMHQDDLNAAREQRHEEYQSRHPGRH